MSLAARHCKPCEGGAPPLPPDEALRLLGDVPDWTLEDNRLRRAWTLSDFQECLGRANAIGVIAEEEGHHPDIHITQYRKLEIVLWTHAVRGLSENDFILAAKIDQVMA